MSGFTQDMMRVFADATGSATHMVRGDAPINFAGFNTYIVGDMAARKLSTFGGEKWDIPFNQREGNHLRNVKPGGTRSLSRTDNVSRMSQFGILKYQDMALVDREIEANQELSTLAQAGAWHMFYDRLYSVLEAKDQEAGVTIVNDMERLVVGGVPNYNQMEDRVSASRPVEVTPLLGFMNEWYLSCFGITTATGFTAGSAGTDYNTAAVAAGGRWISKQGITVNDAANVINGKNIFSCQQKGYSALDVSIAGVMTALVAAQREATFKGLPSFPNLKSSGIQSKSETMGKVWYTSGKGMDVLQATTLTTQDLWPTASRVDPAIAAPSIRGVPLEWVALLDTIAAYAGGTNTTLVTEGQGDAKGPRFYLHDRDAITVIAHRLNWFRERKAAGEALVPDLIGRYLDVEFNLGAVDFRTSACVFPSSTPSGISAY
jgi:hypothetical protein